MTIGSPIQQPHACRPPAVDAVLAALSEELHDAVPHAVSRGPSHSNQLTEVCFQDGRRLIVKWGRYEWDAPRFHAARLAADLLRRRTGVIAPRQLEVEPGIAGPPVEAYWRIPLPTLHEMWPELPERARDRALRSWGEILRRVHKVRLAGHGPLPRAVREPSSIRAFLGAELEGRLPPAVAAWWPIGYELVTTLGALVPEISARVGERPGVLLHNDPHMANVLCERRGTGVRCVGVLDLEAAMAGPPEADLAHAQVLHGPLFGIALSGSWFDRVVEGYAAPVDPVTLAFFRAYHLINLGFHAAMVGFAEHAADVAAAAAAEITALVQGRYVRPANAA